MLFVTLRDILQEVVMSNFNLYRSHVPHILPQRILILLAFSDTQVVTVLRRNEIPFVDYLHQILVCLKTAQLERQNEENKTEVTFY